MVPTGPLYCITMMGMAFVDIFLPFLKMLFTFSLKSWIFILLHAILAYLDFWAGDG